MTKQSTPKNTLLKKLGVIPLLAGLIFLFAERVEAKNTDSISGFDLEQSKDTVAAKEVIRQENLSATKSEIKEYKSLLAKGRRTIYLSKKMY